MQQNNNEPTSKNSNLSCTNLEGKFICADNIDQGTESKVYSNDMICNDHYCCVLAVVQGSMNIVVNGIKLKLKANDYLTIMPYTNIEIKSSRCNIFSMKIEAYILHDIYETIGLSLGVKNGCYTFYHYHLTPRQINILLHDYQQMKSDMSNPSWRYMRVDLVKNRLGAYLAHKSTITDNLEPISHYEDSDSSRLFAQFLELLDENYKTERSVQYYSDRLGVQPKSLSAATVKYTGKTASRVIDEYVTLRIKIVLYNNKHNIKEVSDMFNFASQSFFGRYFKRVAGCSPRKYISINSKKLSKQSGV
ncbi:MAG: AraC family transcriptional regulator [Bacteroidaceae bacterium]|nr:AraC family transcriptional regulator [Bacteroidaceae bacterium]